MMPDFGMPRITSQLAISAQLSEDHKNNGYAELGEATQSDAMSQLKLCKEELLALSKQMSVLDRIHGARAEPQSAHTEKAPPTYVNQEQAATDETVVRVPVGERQ